MPPIAKRAMEEPERSWLDHRSASVGSFIDLDLSLDLVPIKFEAGRDSRRLSSSHRPQEMETRKRNAWAEANDLQSNLHVEIGDRRFQLQKFPLISKSGRLNRLVFELRDPNKDSIALHGIPGGADAFEDAVRFLYGKNIPLNATNVAAIRCAAEYLEMSDSLGEGSLVAKADNYLNLVVVGSWKDSITVLRSCSDLKPFAEELEIVRRCSESVAWKASTDPHGLRWSSSKSSGRREATRSWWFDDVCSLYIDTFSKVINAINSKGIDFTVVAAVLVQYAEKWLGLTQEASKLPETQPAQGDFLKPSGTVVSSMGFSQDLTSKMQIKNRAIVQGIVSLLPSQPDSLSCKFLLKLLRAACAVNAGIMCKTDLARRIGPHLEKLSVDELLMLSCSANGDAMYDVEVVHQIVDYYLQEQVSGSLPVSPMSGARKSSIASATSIIISGMSAAFSDVDTSSVAGRSSVSGTSASRTSISSTISSRTGISGISSSSNSRPSILSSNTSGLSVTSICGRRISGSGTSISRTTSGISDISGCDESTMIRTTSNSEEFCLKVDNRFEKSKFFAKEGPTRKPQLPPTSTNLVVAQILESYLKEVAKDSNISLGKFVALVELFIEFPRESDDCVYRSIDTFLRSHPSLNDQERRKLCKVMDIQALSLDACMHAASNERLPLRVVVSVLFTEQVKLRNAITGSAVVNDKGVDSIPIIFSSASREFNSESNSDPLLSSNASTNTSTEISASSPPTVNGSSSTFYSLSNQNRAPSVALSAAHGAASSAVNNGLLNGLTVKDALQSALSEIESLRTAVQEIEMLKARLGLLNVLQQDMENMNRKFMDLAHDYTEMTNQVEELTKVTKHKSSWTSGLKKMAKPFHGKDQPDTPKAFNHMTVTEKHLKAAPEIFSLYQQMNILHPTDVPFLQNLQTSNTSLHLDAAKTPVESPQPASDSKTLEVKSATPVKVVVPHVEPQEVEVVRVQPLSAAPEELPSNSVEAVASEAEKSSVIETADAQQDSALHQCKQVKTPVRQSRNLHRPTSPPSDGHHGRHHVKDYDSISISSDKTDSGAHSNPRHRHRDTISGHRNHRDHSEDRNHRSSPHGRGGHRAHHRHKDISPERHMSNNHHGDCSPDGRHRRSHYSPEHHLRKGLHLHGKDPPRPSNASASNHLRDRSPDDRHRRGHLSPEPHLRKEHPQSTKDPLRLTNANNHKYGLDHHSGNHSHLKLHHRSHHKHHHRRDYDSVSSFSSDSGSRPSRPRRHSGV